MRARLPCSRAGKVAGVALLAIVLGFPSPALAQLDRPEVSDVRFEGNRVFPSDSLERAIVTRETECRSIVFAPFCWAGAEFALRRSYLPGREFPLDQIRLERWYYIRGYREAAVDTATTLLPDGRARVTFGVDEGEPVRVASIEFLGAEEFEGTGLLENLPIAEGAPLNALLMDVARDTLVRRLANRGYARADVLLSSFIPNTDPYHASVTYDIAPGALSRYGHVSIGGIESLTQSTVLRTLQFRAGDLYRLDQLQEAQARLFGLEIVRAANLQPNYASWPDSIIPVHVEIREGEPHRVRTGAGWSSAECLDVDARWISRNFMGGARRLQVRGRVSNLLAQDFQQLLCWQSGQGVFGKLNWIASVDLSQPWIFSTRNSFQASLYGERQSLPDAFVRKAVGLQLSLTRAIGPRTPLTASYRPELSRLDAAEILFCTNFLVCTPEDIGTLLGAHWLAPVGLTFTRSTTDDVLNPSRGYHFLADVEHADAVTGSNFTYSRVVSELSRFGRAGTFVLASRLRLGWVGAGAFEELLGRQSDIDIVHPQKRFFAGGANSVRGFPQGRLGPRVLQAREVDLLRPTDDEGSGAGCTPEELVDLTCDASALEDGRFLPRPTGGTRLLEGNLELRFPLGRRLHAAAFTDFGQAWGAQESVSLESVELTPGLGVRYMSPIGPLRLDIAYRFRGGEDLAVVTNQIREAEPGETEELLEVGGEKIPWVRTDALAILGPRVLFDDSGPWSLRRFQLHLSIGQAF